MKVNKHLKIALDGENHMWWIAIPLSIVLLLIAAYLAFAVFISKSAFFVKKRSYETVLYQDEKYNIPRSVSVLPFEKVVIKGSQGYDMTASYMPARDGESHDYFIILHGYNSNRVTANKYANILLDIGYNTLCPDMRRCGETGGKGITFGTFESVDVNLWIDYIYKRDPEARISLYGISLGAATAIMVASKRDDIRLLVSYCSYASLKEITIDRMAAKKVPRALAKALYPAVNAYLKIVLCAPKRETDICKAIKKVNCPILIMHSTGDRFTDIRHAYKLKEARPDAEFVEFDGAPHGRSYGVYPEKYSKAVKDFVNNNR